MPGRKYLTTKYKKRRAKERANRIEHASRNAELERKHSAEVERYRRWHELERQQISAEQDERKVYYQAMAHILWTHLRHNPTYQIIQVGQLFGMPDITKVAARAAEGAGFPVLSVFRNPMMPNPLVRNPLIPPPVPRPVCRLCNQPITKEDGLNRNLDIVILNGRSYPVHKNCPTIS